MCGARDEFVILRYVIIKFSHRLGGVVDLIHTKSNLKKNLSGR